MQPIKTTNAMNPAPAKGIESFPTPVIDDVVISEIVNSWKGDYQPLEYGTLWKDVPHAPNQGSFPEHKLVFQQPTSEDGQWVKRIWVNDRVNQDSYNYAIKYSAGSQQHPIYIRTYVVPRATYAPLPDGTPDPLFPSAILVDEEVTRNEGELDSKYITVSRVYETLPGPELTGKQMVTQFGGGVVNTKRQTVFKGATGANTLSPDFRTLQTSIAPEDSTKSIIETVELPSGEEWPILTTLKDGPFNERIIVTSQVVPIGTPLPANANGIIYESEAVDKWRSIHTSRNLSNLIGKKFVEYEMISYSFPGLLIVRGRTFASKQSISYQRPGLSGLYRSTTITQFFIDIPKLDEVDETISFAPVSFSCDAGSFSGVLHNCQYITMDGVTVRAPQSIPSSLDYDAGGNFLIRSTITKEQIGLYRSVKTYITLK